MNNSNNIKEKLNQNGKIEPNNSKVPPALSNLGNKMPDIPKQHNKNSDDNKTENQKSTEETKNKINGAGVDLKSRATNMALGAAANQEGAVGAAARTAIKIKKIKTAWTIASAVGPVVLPILGGILIFLLVASAVMIPIMYIGENINEISGAVTSFGDKFTNMITFNGFKDSSNVVSDKIKSEKDLYDKYKEGCKPKIDSKKKETANDTSEDTLNPEIANVYATDCVAGDFDEGILISTLQVNNTIDYAAYDLNEVPSQSDYESTIQEDFDKVTIDAEDVSSFYSYAGKVWLGASSLDYNFVDPSNKKALLWNLVDRKIEWKCVPNQDAFFNYLVNWSDIIGEILKGVTTDVATTLDFLDVTSIPKIVDTIKSMQALSSTGTSYWEFLKQNYNYANDTSKAFTDQNYSVLRLLWNSSKDYLSCSEGYSQVPILVRFMNYDNYVNYLKEVYIPLRYFECESCKKMEWTDEAKKQITKDTISEILDQRNAYYEGIGKKSDIYLVVDEFGNYTIDGDTGVYTGGVHPVGTSGTGWKQGDSNWGSFKLASSSDTTMARIGCYVTSIATVIANSGTKINGTMFDPGVLASVIKQNGGFNSSGSLQSYAWTSIAPNFVSEGMKPCSNYAADCGNTISEYLSQGKFVVVNVPHHFVAVVGADENGIIISDPARGPETEYLSKYNGVIKGLRVFHKTD